MKFIAKIDHHFWVYLLGAVACGFLFPRQLQPFENIVIYIMMAILFLVFLKADVADVFKQIKKPGILVYILSLTMIAIPIVIFYLFKPVDPDLRMALVLLAALPAGVPAAVFTDIMDGHTSLTLIIIFFSTLIAPFTIPFLFWILYHATFSVDFVSLFKNLLMILIIPLVASQVFRAFLEPFVEKGKHYINTLVLACFSFTIMVIMSLESEYVLSHIRESLYIIGMLYGAFVMIQLMSYFGVYWLKKSDKVAVSNSKVMMNNILGIILALAFFEEKIAVIMILATIPFNTMISVFHWYKKYLP